MVTNEYIPTLDDWFAGRLDGPPSAPEPDSVITIDKIVGFRNAVEMDVYDNASDEYIVLVVPRRDSPCCDECGLPIIRCICD